MWRLTGEIEHEKALWVDALDLGLPVDGLVSNVVTGNCVDEENLIDDLFLCTQPEVFEYLGVIIVHVLFSMRLY